VAGGNDEGVAGLLVQAGGMLAGRAARLPPGSLEATRLKDANVAEPSKAVVQSLGWHPGGQLMLTAGLDKKLRLFKVHCRRAGSSCCNRGLRLTPSVLLSCCCC
jgi:U3 small nucleolar RNA-associated protein 18